MSDADRTRWDERYAAGAFSERTHPSAYLKAQFAQLGLGAGARALDIACGAGRNTLFLARQGLEVDALDISEVALQRLDKDAQRDGLPVVTHAHDLDQPLPFADDSFDLLIVIRYVNLTLLRPLSGLLRPGGILLIEEHLRSHVRVNGPGSDRFRVAPGALRRAINATGHPMQCLHEFEGLVNDPDGSRAALARLLARRPTTARV